jgi:PAS domain S-box-containing protein
MPSAKSKSERSLRAELKRVKASLAESAATIKAIQSGDVDAVVVDGLNGSSIFTLQSPEDPYRILAERMNEGAATLTAEGTVTFCNRRMAEMVGLSAERLLGSSFPALLREQDRPAAAELLRSAIKNDIRADSHLLRPDGSTLPVLLSLSSISLEESGQGICLVATDLSELKRAEAVREHLAAVVDSSDDAIISKDLNGVINAWNRGAEKVFGYSAAEAVGKLMLLLFPPELVSEESDILERIRRGESIKNFETVRLRKDGRKIDVSVTISPVRDGNGAIVGASKIARDITERIRTQEALRQSDVRRGYALDTSKIGDWDLDLTTLQATRSALHDQIFGYAEPLPQWNFDIFLRHVHPEDRERVRETFQINIRQKKKSEFECRIVHPNGDIRWIWACGDQIRDSSGKATRMFSIVQDITERKNIANSLARQTDELLRSQQALEVQTLMLHKLNEELEARVAQRTEQLEVANRELESFTYSVSHDLRAPLRHIMGFAGACLEEFGATLDPQALHYVQRIQDGTRRMGLLTDELLNLARTGQRSLRLQVTGLNAVVDEIILMLKAETEGREVEWKISDLPSVECDPILVRQIFQNLLSNAIKYSRPRPHAIIEVGHTQQNDRSVIFVRDNGVGFNMKYADKLFGVFQRLHRDEDFEGTGVGLATVYRIVQKHGGRIWAEAEVDHGATFYFTLGGSERVGSRGDAATAGA